MTDYDRGMFVANQTITIEPLASGTFLIRRTPRAFEPQSTDQAIGFSSASDMLKFLQSEYSNDPRGQGENPDKAPLDLVLRMVDDREKTGLTVDDIAKACDWPLGDVVDALAQRYKDTP